MVFSDFFQEFSLPFFFFFSFKLLGCFFFFAVVFFSFLVWCLSLILESSSVLLFQIFLLLCSFLSAAFPILCISFIPGCSIFVSILFPFSISFFFWEGIFFIAIWIVCQVFFILLQHLKRWCYQQWGQKLEHLVRYCDN